MTTHDDETNIAKMHHIINDIERIGDHATNFMNIAKTTLNEDLSFSEYSIKEIKNMRELIKKMFVDTTSILNNGDKNLLQSISIQEQSMDDLVLQCENNHIERLKEGVCSIDSGSFFYDITSQMERVADHLTNISYSIVDVAGDEK